jgi:hypothetical protein
MQTTHIVSGDGQLFLMTTSDPRFNLSHKPITLAHDTKGRVLINGHIERLYLGDNGQVYGVANYDSPASQVQPLGHMPNRPDLRLYAVMDGTVCIPATVSDTVAPVS